jgi:hypothetical protein
MLFNFKNSNPLQLIDGTILEPKEIVDGKHLYVIKGSKQPISYYYGKERDFQLISILIQKEDQNAVIIGYANIIFFGFLILLSVLQLFKKK